MEAQNNQSWWDAACNCNPENAADLADITVLSDEQYEIYRQIRNNSGRGGTAHAISMHMNPEERFMYILFFHHSNMESSHYAKSHTTI